MRKTCKYFFMLAFICLLTFNPSASRVDATNSGNYEERIFMEISPPSGQVLLGFMFTNVSGPLLDTSDFLSDPSFISISIGGTYSPEDNTTVIMVILNASEIVSISQGKLKADILKAKLEKLFDITLPYSKNFTYGDRVFYSYRIDERSTIQKFRDVFLEHKPSQGFGKIITPILIENYVSIAFDLRRKGNLLEWTITATVNYPNYFEMNFGKEYVISLKDLTGYSEAIQASPKSSNSTLSILIGQVNKKLLSLEPYKLISIETIPSHMEKKEGTFGAFTAFGFEKTITGSSAEDLSIHFKIVSPNYVDPTTIIIAIALVAVVAISGVAGYSIRRRRKETKSRYVDN